MVTIVDDDETYTVYYGTDSMALVNSITGMGNASVSNEFNVTINGLMPFTTYYYIISAENSEETTNTSVMTFMTNETGMGMTIEIVYLQEYIILGNSVAPICFLTNILINRYE